MEKLSSNEDIEVKNLEEIFEKFKGNPSNDQDKVLQPFNYISKISGGLFKELLKAFGYWFKLPQEKFDEIKEIMIILKAATIIADDIEDNSLYRKGIPTAHSIYGVASTINCSNYLAFLALDKIQKLNHPDAVGIYIELILEIHIGQGTEIYWRDNFICPEESELMVMTIQKSNFYFSMPLRLMQLFSDNKKDFKKFAALLGLFYQIRDDYCDLVDSSSSHDFCEDITEGKFSVPIAHAIRTEKNDKQVSQILKQKTRNAIIKKYCLTLLKQLGSLEYTRKILDALVAKLKVEIEILGGNPFMIEFLNLSITWKANDDN